MKIRWGIVAALGFLFASITASSAAVQTPSEFDLFSIPGNEFTVLVPKINWPASESLLRTRVYRSEILRILERHPYWQTIPYSSIKVPGGIEVVTAKTFKKWKTNFKSGSLVELEETTQLSLQFDEDSQALKWGSERIDLSGLIDLKPYYFEGVFDKKPDKMIRVIDEDRFEIISSDGDVHIVFVQASPTFDHSFQVEFGNIGAWTAPLGQSKEALQAIIHLTKDDTAYLHHDLKKMKIIAVDVSFPEIHLPALHHSINEWNKAFGEPFFQTNLARAKIDISDCISSNTLCINWKGPATIPWTGVGGSTFSSFDPDSGEVLGGVITFMNSADESALKTTPGDYDNQFISGKFDRDWVVSVYLQTDSFVNYKHPIPELPIQTILLHEMGHFNGLSHNFMGSNSGDVQRPSESIMDYVSFPSIRNFGLGRFDFQVLDAVYRGVQPDSTYRFCSDYEKDGSLGYKAKLANCNAFDLGDSADWYILLADKSKTGVFTNIPLNPTIDILYYLGAFLTPAGGASQEENARVTRYLCSKTESLDQIRKELLDVHKVTLVCR